MQPDPTNKLTHRLHKWLLGSVAGRGAMSLVALGAVCTVGLVGTQALLTDQVTMAQVEVEGGTLDITANGSDGPNAGFTAFSGALDNMKPGDERFADVSVKNNGTLDGLLSVTVDGEEVAPDNTGTGCFSYFFRETGGDGATKNVAPYPVDGMGTAAGADGTTNLFETDIAAEPLTDVDSSTDNTWEAGETKTYRLTVRMRSECDQGQGGDAAATGTLDFTFDAVPA